MTSRLDPVRRLLGIALAVLVLLPAPASATTAATPDSAASPAPAPGAAVLTHGPRTRPVVALTFDDGWGARTCGDLVRILETTHTAATFFPNAVYVERSPRLWRYIAQLGFPIGNHTTSHPPMPSLDYRHQLAQIASDRTIVERVIGMPTIPVFRPPYGLYDATTVRAAGAAGYAYVLNWDASFADSSRRRGGRPWPIASYVRAASRGVNGSVILGHCGSPVDLAALPAVIAGYRARGFTFVTVPQLLGMPGAGPMTFPAYPSSPPLPSPTPPPALPRAL
jgi:peptidoglycan/xylan/chitin deacetylase (PgdA/CDA1 family)